MLPEEYPDEVLVPDTNKGLSVPMDLQEYMQWVGCWLYMTWWIGIDSRWDWYSTTTPSMAKGAPFRLNRIISCNRFDYILSALVLRIERCHMRMASYKCANWRKLGTRIWLNSFCHNGSMFLMSPWCSGSTSGLLNLCVPAVNRIPLAMSSIQYVALSPPFCGGESATNCMPLISKGMRFTADTHKSRRPLVEPLHHGLIKNIDPWWQKLLSHIQVPRFLQLAHLWEAILIWHLSICKTKSTENRI